MASPTDHDHPGDRSHDHLADRPASEFRPWRLLGVIGVVLVVLVAVAVAVDFVALG